jgi:hypothetical protein
MPRHVPDAVAALVVALLALCCGCSGRVATYPVTGTVRFDDGQPVIGFIEFRSADTGITARSKLAADGSFRLGTFAAYDGAPAGDYKAIVVQYFSATPARHVHESAAEEAATHEGQAHTTETSVRVDPKFANYSTSPLRATVVADDTNELDFVVKRDSSKTQPRR